MQLSRGDVFNSVTLDQKGADVLSMKIANPDFPIADEIKHALTEELESGRLLYTQMDKRTTGRIEAMAEKVKKRNRVEAAPEDIMVTSGVLPSMWLAVKYACQPGDQVIVTDPMYPPFFGAAEACNVRIVYHKLDESRGYGFDIDALNELVTDRTKLIFVCNPHNPCGRVLTKKELRGIGEVAVDHKMTIMSDELWEDVVLDEREHVSIASLSPEIEERVMTAFGFSKTYGVGGLYLGYLVATNKQMMETLREISGNAAWWSRGPSNLSMVAAPCMLDETLKWWREGLTMHIAKLRNLIEKRFSEMPGITCPKLEGTYLMFPNLRSYGKTSREMTDYLLKEGKIRVSEGSEYGSNGEGHIRICIATSEEIIIEALDRIEHALSKLMKPQT